MKRKEGLKILSMDALHEYLGSGLGPPHPGISWDNEDIFMEKVGWRERERAVFPGWSPWRYQEYPTL